MGEASNSSLLECILRLADAEKYLQCFKDEDLKAYNLGVLNEKDLELIGIDKPETREKIIRASSNLYINMEKKIIVDIDVDYAKFVLNEIERQVRMHNSNLALCAYRPDIVNVNVDLKDSTEVLMSGIHNLRKELQDLKNVINGKPEAKRNWKHGCMQAIIISIGIVCFSCLLRKLNK